MNFPVGSYGSLYWGSQGSSNTNFYPQGAQGGQVAQTNNNVVTAYNWNTPYAIYDSSFYDKYKGSSGGYVPAPAGPKGGAVTNAPAPATRTAQNRTAAPAAVSAEVQLKQQAYENLKEARDEDKISHDEFIVGYDNIYGTNIGRGSKATPATQQNNTSTAGGNSAGSTKSATEVAALAQVAQLQAEVAQNKKEIATLTTALTTANAATAAVAQKQQQLDAAIAAAPTIASGATQKQVEDAEARITQLRTELATAKAAEASSSSLANTALTSQIADLTTKVTNAEAEIEKLATANATLAEAKAAAERQANYSNFAKSTLSAQNALLDKKNADGSTVLDNLTKLAGPIFRHDSPEVASAGDQYSKLSRRKLSKIVKNSPEDAQQAVLRDANGNMLNYLGQVTTDIKEAVKLSPRKYTPLIDEDGKVKNGADGKPIYLSEVLKKPDGSDYVLHERMIDGKRRYSTNIDSKIWYVTPHAATQAMLNEFPGIGDELSGFITAGWSNQTEKRVMTTSADETNGIVSSTGPMGGGHVRLFSNVTFSEGNVNVSAQGYIPTGGKIIVDKKDTKDTKDDKTLLYGTSAFSFRNSFSKQTSELQNTFDTGIRSQNIDATTSSLYILDNILHLPRKADKVLHPSLILDGELSSSTRNRTTNGKLGAVTESKNLAYFVAPAINFTFDDKNSNFMGAGAKWSGYLAAGKFGRVNSSSSATNTYVANATTPAITDYLKTETNLSTTNFSKSSAINGAELYSQLSFKDKHGASNSFFSIFSRYHVEKTDGFSVNWTRESDLYNPNTSIPHSVAGTKADPSDPTKSIPDPDNPNEKSSSGSVSGETKSFLLRGIGVHNGFGGVAWFNKTQTLTPTKFTTGSGSSAQDVYDFDITNKSLFGWFLDTGMGSQAKFAKGKANFEFNGFIDKTTSFNAKDKIASVSRSTNIAPRINYAIGKGQVRDKVWYATVGLDYNKNSSVNLAQTTTLPTEPQYTQAYFKQKTVETEKWNALFGINYLNKNLNYFGKSKGWFYAGASITTPVLWDSKSTVSYTDPETGLMTSPQKSTFSSPFGFQLSAGFRF